MKKPAIACVSLLALVQLALVSAQGPARPTEPIAAIIEAFRTHDVVAITDPHGNEQVQTFLLSLLRDPRFAEAANDVVVETASARYQDVIDRFVRGDDIRRESLRRAWEDHTNPGLGMQIEEVLRAVRTVNTSRRNPMLRVIAGDPPIDWDSITSNQDHRKWIELRDSYPADLIRRQVLDRGRRALVIYGQMHLQRRQIASNYDMSVWQAQTLVSLLAQDPAVRTFNVWTFLDRNVEPPAELSSWPVPSLVMTSGTTFGAMDFGAYTRGLGARFSVKNGRLAPLAEQEWQKLPMENQFRALLYLGSPASMTNVQIPATLCRDAEFVKRWIQRRSGFNPTNSAPPVEVENFKKACEMQ